MVVVVVSSGGGGGGGGTGFSTFQEPQKQSLQRKEFNKPKN